MRKIIFTAIITFLSLCSLKAEISYLKTQSPSMSPLHEVRAVWLTTIGGIDWPHSYARLYGGISRQQQELCDILDRLAASNINTVILQTRVRATTIFPSSMEPWDGCLSGKPGESPGYDALAFAINECHKRGMKLHAWVVTIPVGKWNGAGCKNLRNTCPSIVKKIGDEGFMNPEAVGTADYIARFCIDLVTRYDIDGIHLDYIRYPDTWGVIKDKDRGRENITRIVRTVSNAVKSVKPWVQMSCSPVGKYADTKRQWAHGWNARDIVCQDAVKWLKEGLMDALYPMMYFKNENFYPFAIDWQERSCGKIIAPGLGIYFMHPREKNWSLDDITRELYAIRQYGMGNCMFRSKFFTDNTKGIYDHFQNTFAPLPSLQPAMTWISHNIPSAPKNLTISQSGNNTVISWDEALNNERGGTLYNLYGSDTAPVDVTKAENLLAANLNTTRLNVGNIGNTTFFAVTSTDRYGNESRAIQSCEEELSIESRLFHNAITYSKGVLFLDKADVSIGGIVVLTTIQGNDYTSAIVRDNNGRYVALTGKLPVGHYKLYKINKKGIKHLLGIVSVPQDRKLLPERL